ncbi:MAG TPA: hypothetical protein VJA66_05180, partial [Thermoanaerobaculia bacterium]
MSSTQSPEVRNAGRRLLAPRWHTAGLFGILLLTFGVGAWLQHRAAASPGAGTRIAPAHSGVIGIYVTAI